MPHVEHFKVIIVVLGIIVLMREILVVRDTTDLDSRNEKFQDH